MEHKHKTLKRKTKEKKKSSKIVINTQEKKDEEEIRNLIQSTHKLKKIVKEIKKNIIIDKKLLEKCIKCLKVHSERILSKSKNILGEEDFIYLTVTMSKLRENYSPRPIQITLPEHPIYSEDLQTKVCLIVKDTNEGELKKSIKDLAIPCVTKILEYSKVMRNYSQFKDKRELINEYDLFLCDSRIYKMLPKVLGRGFYRKKKFPYAVNIMGKGEEGVREALFRGINSTYLMLGNGPHYSLPVGRSSFNLMDNVHNVMQAIYSVIAYILGAEIPYEKVLSISLKTANSVELPIYNHLEQDYLHAYAQ